MRRFYSLCLLSALPLVGFSAGNSTSLPALDEASSVVQSENPLADDGIHQAKKMIKGVVKDDLGEPVPGANVIEKGTTNGVMTDMDGNFSLSVAPNAVLEISYIGYTTQEVQVKGQSVINVVLTEDTQALEEVVVIGYGTVKKKDLTGSVSRISPSAYKAQPVQGTSEMLRGNTPGLIVSETAGTTTVRIRGYNSLNGDNSPLYIVDGVPGGSYNPNDVESIEVLKDASATAIYGSRGANGVILITTKRGKSGKPTVEVQANATVASYGKYYDMLDGNEFEAGYNAYMKNMGVNRTFDKSINTDWQRLMTQTGLRQNYQASLSGGSEAANYHVSAGYTDNKGTNITQRNRSYRMRSNLDFKLSKKFTGRLDLSASRGDSYGAGSPQGKGALLYALLWNPNIAPYQADGELTVADPYSLTTNTNPLLDFLGEQNQSYSTGVHANAYLAYEIIDGLKVSVQPMYSTSFWEGQYYQTRNADASKKGYAQKQNSLSTTWQVTGLVNYEKSFNQVHNLNAMLGTEVYESVSSSTYARGTNITNEDFLWNNLASSETQRIGSGWGASQLASFFGRVNYNYASKYYATVSVRADGSSKFAPGNKFSYFPSGALGWVLTQEEFLKDNDVLQYLKLRGSWGQTGSQAIGSYATMSRLGNGERWPWGTTTYVQGVYISEISNPNLKWETTTQWDLGIDMNITDKWSFTVDYYNKTTDDLLTNRKMPEYSGGSNMRINLGTMKNSGVDFSVTYRPIVTKDLNWTMTANASVFKNKVQSLGDIGEYFIPGSAGNLTAVQLEINPIIVQEGQPLGQLYGYEWLGLWRTDEAEEAAKFGQKPGDNKYRDVNGNGKYDNDDRMVIGNFLPKFTWSYNTTLAWKDWDFNLMIEAAHGQDMFNFSKMVAAANGGLREQANNLWSETNQDTMWGLYSVTSLEKANSSKWVESASYVKLRNLSVGYTIPKQLLGGHEFRVSVSGQNLLTFTPYSGLDPEASFNRGNNGDMVGGIEYGSYPQQRRVTFGLNYKF